MDDDPVKRIAMKAREDGLCARAGAAYMADFGSFPRQAHYDDPFPIVQLCGDAGRKFYVELKTRSEVSYSWIEAAPFDSADGVARTH